MNIRIESNFNFSVSSIQYAPNGELQVTTNYLQGFILHLQSKGMKPGSVRLYFQKLACVLHDAYKIRGGNVNYNHIYFVGNDLL